MQKIILRCIYTATTLATLAAPLPFASTFAADPAAPSEDGGDQARARPTGTIRFTFAASKSLGISSQRLRSSISQMDALTRISDYGAGADYDGAAFPADVACAGVRFELTNDGILEPNGLPEIFASGIPGYDWDAFTSVVKADVYVVSSITCGTVTDAIGCAPRGGRPRVVTAAFGGLDGGTILHEDLHTRGFGHSNGDGVCPRDYRSARESAWRRIMYCQANPFAKGLIESECRALGGTSVAADSPLLAQVQNGASQDVALSANVAVELPEALRYLLKNAKLEGNRVNPDILRISQDETKLIQKVVENGSPIDLLQGAIVALGEVGSISDAYLLKSFIVNPGLPASNLVITAKLAAATAIGRIGGRLNSTAVLSELIPLTAPERAAQAVGPAFAEALRLQATLALGEGKEAAQPLIKGLQEKQGSATSGRSTDIKALNPSTDSAIINEIQRSSPISPSWLNKSLEISLDPAR